MKARVTIEIPYKEWLHNEAEKLGISIHALEVRLHRGRHPYPASLKRGRSGRAIAVVVHQQTKLSHVPK